MSFLRGLLRPNEEFLIQAARYLVVGWNFGVRKALLFTDVRRLSKRVEIEA